MLWNWLIYQIPWQVQVSILLMLALVGLYFIGRIFGWGVAKQIALPVLGVLAAIGIVSRAGQQGYGARKEQEQQADDQARGEFNEIHRKNEALPDDALDRKNAPWIKP